MLGLEVHDEPPHGGRQSPALGRLGAEEALHALRLEEDGLPPQRATRGRPGLLRAPVSRAAEQHQGADELVVSLLGPAAQERYLLPGCGRLDAPPERPARHAPPSSRARLRRGWGRMPQTGLRGQPKSRYASQTLRRGFLRPWVSKDDYARLRFLVNEEHALAKVVR